MTSEDPNMWKTPTFRQSMIAKIEEEMQKYQISMSKNASDMESHLFMKAKSKDEYLAFIAKLIIHISQSKKPGGTIASGATNTNIGVQQGMPDPIGALQTLARQGTGNNANMGMQTSIQNPQMILQQNPVLQNLNQRPAQPINMPGMQNKMPNMGMMHNQQGCPPMGVNQMNQMQSMPGNPMMTQINQINQGNLGQPMGPQLMQSQQIGGPQINVSQMGPNQMQILQNQMQNQIGAHQLGGPMNAGMQPTMQQQQGPPQQHMNQINTAQIAANQLTQAQLGQMQRKPVEMMNTAFPGTRNMTPNQFLRQSPSPSVPSPGGLGVPTPSNQMVASPALVSSPNPQHALLGGAQRSMAMSVSPSSSVNTPAGAIATTPSPLLDEQTTQAYKEKVRKLSKYIEPLRRMISKTTSEGNTEKMSKMKKLLEVLTNPTSSTKLDVLHRCEMVLEKLDFKKFEATGGPGVQTTLKEHHFFTPLLEVVTTVLQSPVANHTLHRTFGPCLEVLFGPEIKNVPPPLKRRKTEESSCEIPDVLQGEIARLDQRFKISLDPAQQNGSKCIQLICWLDDKHLPCVPPVLVIVPTDYPSIPPRCVLTSHEYTTSYLKAVQKGLDARLAKLPKRYSISQLLNTWEMSVRQASAPKVHQRLISSTTTPATITSTITTTGTTNVTTTVTNVINPIVNGISANNMITMAGS
ncbi:mediator of RNA polymerase II transcription subunit 15-like isoform X2 [Phymastichus coffea]|nr:mediator of RNA polymerase II transcription subunit 15-like isoform X2 [Phymastichus coffea]